MLFKTIWFCLAFSFILNQGVAGTEIKVIYNNIPGSPGFESAWGLSYLIRAGKKNILFDTGGDPELLTRNLKKAGVRPDEIDTVVRSHYHLDHYGGLEAVLKPNLPVFLPASFPPGFKRELRRKRVRVIEVKDPVRIAPGVWSTGILGDYIPEQSLLVKTASGLVVITGCSHPGVENICLQAHNLFPGKIYLVTGGFHLGAASPEKVKRIIKELKALAVGKVAPNHCTGSTAIRMFKEAWGDNFIHLGVGEELSIGKSAPVDKKDQ